MKHDLNSKLSGAVNQAMAKAKSIVGKMIQDNESQASAKEQSAKESAPDVLSKTSISLKGGVKNFVDRLNQAKDREKS